jgi:hypothetical protein
VSRKPISKAELLSESRPKAAIDRNPAALPLQDHLRLAYCETKTHCVSLNSFARADRFANPRDYLVRRPRRGLAIVVKE